MPPRRRTTFQGLHPQAVKELIAIQEDWLAELRALRDEAIGSTTDTKQRGTISARFNERLRVLPDAADGIDLVFPGATSQTQNRWIEVLKLGGGDCRVSATSGTVQGVVTDTLTTPGFYYYQSDGTGGWWRQP